MSPDELIAAGWEIVEPGGFTSHAGPIWTRKTGSSREMGLLVEDKHSNNHIGTLHGGVVMTFADIGLGSCVSDAIDHVPCVTVSLQTNFVSVARIGEFITCDAEIVRKTKQLVFVRGLIKAGDKTIASAEGMWKILETTARLPSSRLSS